MKDVLLTFNAGSATVKFALYSLDGNSCGLLIKGEIDNSGTSPGISIINASADSLYNNPLADVDDYHSPIQWILGWVLKWIAACADDQRLVAVGHRVVHGGSEFGAPVIIDEAILAKLTALSPLAPLHQPHNLAAIKQITELAPELIQVACFDTGFHRSNPAVATQYALPRALSEEGVKRYGFHGLSYHYIADVLPDFAKHRSEGRVIVAHLGSGASLCALLKRKSIATTMGFTALDGLPMAERCGDLDPGVLLYLIKQKGMDYNQLTQLLYHQSGLLGVSGISGDMRVLEQSDSIHARDAINLFSYRTGREIGSLAAALGGLDLLVFTGGIGENSAAVRAAVCEQAAWLGVSVDASANCCGATMISSTTSRVGVYVIATDENQVIAQTTQRLLNQCESQQRQRQTEKGSKHS